MMLSVVTLAFWGVPVVAEQAAIRATIQPRKERQAAPVFRLQDANGKSAPLSEFRGHVVLLNFWATECGGCRTELPYFMEFDHTYRSKGLQTLGISMEVIYQDLKGPEEGWARVKPFAKEHRIEYPILMADTATSKAFAIDQMPATYLIDKRGRVAAKYIGVVDKADVEANLKTLLAER
jgi:peroxiredoxin